MSVSSRSCTSNKNQTSARCEAAHEAPPPTLYSIHQPLMSLRHTTTHPHHYPKLSPGNSNLSTGAVFRLLYHFTFFSCIASAFRRKTLHKEVTFDRGTDCLAYTYIDCAWFVGASRNDGNERRSIAVLITKRQHGVLHGGLRDRGKGPLRLRLLIRMIP